MIEADPQLAELKRNAMKRLPRNYQEIGLMRDLRNHHNQIQRTSWSDLRQIAYEDNEEDGIKHMLGIPVNPKPQKSPRQIRDSGLGGGGKSGLRS